MKLFWLIVFILPVRVLAQSFPVDAGSGKIYYAEEVLVKDSPQADLYYRGKTWFASSGKNKQNLQIDDFANGLLIGNNYLLLSVSNGNSKQLIKLWYSVQIQMEDDRYWYSISNLHWQKNSGLTGIAPEQTTKQPLEAMIFSKKAANLKEKQFNKSLKNTAHNSLTALIQGLKKSML